MRTGVVIHYPRDGATYMVGHCGASSLSSDKDLKNVTCERCMKKHRNTRNAQIDWESAPEGFPVWIESLDRGISSQWHRDAGDRYIDKKGYHWPKDSSGRYYRVHIQHN